MLDGRESALADPQVAAFRALVAESGQFFCQRDVEALMKECGIKTNRYKDVLNELVNEGLLCRQRFKNAIIIWSPIGEWESGDEADVAEEDDAESSAMSDEVKRLQAADAECQRRIAAAQAALGQTSTACINEKCAAIEHEIGVLREQTDARRREGARRLVTELRASEVVIARCRRYLSALQTYISGAYVGAP